MQQKIEKLDNGIQCLFVEDSNSPSFNFNLQFKIGSRYENLGNAGVAHLIEHMFFKGTKKRPTPKELAFTIENLGAQINAWTSHEQTVYYVTSPKEKAFEVIDFLYEQLFDSIFQKDELEKEKKVIAEEIKMSNDSPRSKVFDIFLENLFKDHQLGWDIAGTLKSVEGLTAKDCKKFIQEHYAPENLLIVVAGNFDHKAIKSYLNKLFGKWENKVDLKFESFQEEEIEEKRIETYRKLEQMHIVIGGYFYNYLDLTKKERWALTLGKMVMSVGFGSLLNMKFRDELALTYYIYLTTQSFIESGYYAIALGVSPDKKDLAVNEVLKFLKDFEKGNFDEKDLERAKNLLLGNLITYFETSSALASLYATQLQFEGEIQTPDEIKNQIMKVDSQEIIKVWSKILKKEKVISILGSVK